jgi:hypothetical protein
MTAAKSTDIFTLTAISILFFILGTASFFALSKGCGLPNYITSASLLVGVGCSFYFAFLLSNLNMAFKALAATFFFLILSFIASNLLFDVSWDGISYHQGAIMALTENFDFLHSSLNSSNPVDNVSWSDKFPFTTNVFWMNSYPKLSWFYAASIYELTGNIQYGKSINFLLLFALGLVAWAALSDLPRSARILSATALTLNPIVMSQLFAYYNDGVQGAFLIIAIIGLYGYFWSKRTTDFLLLAIAGMIGCAALKFTGLVFSSCVMFAAFYLAYRMKPASLSSVAKPALYIPIVMMALLLMANPYIKNMADGKHIFHPVMGEDKVDIISHQIPQQFIEKDRFSKLMLSVLGKSEHGTRNSNSPLPKIKIPFQFSKREFKSFRVTDLRWGGWGPLFGGVFLVTLVCLLMRYSKIKEYTPLVFLLALLSIINPESWWARYNPQLHTFVVVSLLLLYIKDPKLQRVAKFMLAILIVNSFLLLGAHFMSTLLQNREIETVINEISDNGSYPVCWDANTFHLEPIFERFGITLQAHENCGNSTQFCEKIVWDIDKICRLDS